MQLTDGLVGTNSAGNSSDGPAPLVGPSPLEERDKNGKVLLVWIGKFPAPGCVLCVQEKVAMDSFL